jgi:3-hydroxyisobutyrate dehydrogenase/2-hydroxy-3-oxopropionate reductase
MARNLCAAGHEVRAWSHTASKAERLAAEAGATACSSPKAVAESTECIFLCVGNTEMSREVIFGADGIASGAAPNAVIVDTSTVSALESQAMAEKLSKRGFHFVDAPCTGSKLGAEGGKLTFMIGGDAEVYERIKPYFEPMGKQLFYCGDQGMGIRVKLAQNLIQANVLQAFAEGIVLSTKAGVDPQLMLDVLNNTAAKSGLIAFKAPYIYDREFSTHFSTKWMNKDVGLALELADALEVPVPITSITKQVYQAAMAQGFGEDDFISIIKVLEGMAGVVVKKKF